MGRHPQDVVTGAEARIAGFEERLRSSAAENELLQRELGGGFMIHGLVAGTVGFGLTQVGIIDDLVQRQPSRLSTRRSVRPALRTPTSLFTPDDPLNISASRKPTRCVRRPA